VGYCNKNPVETTNTLSVVHTALKQQQAAGLEEDSLLLLKRVILAIDKKIEISAQMAAMSVLGFPSFHCSHSFCVINVSAVMRSAISMFGIKAKKFEKLNPLLSQEDSMEESSEDGDRNEEESEQSSQEELSVSCDDTEAEKEAEQEQGEQGAEEGEQENAFVAQDQILFRVVRMEGDGNCLFRAFAHAFDGNQENHARFREEGGLWRQQNRGVSEEDANMIPAAGGGDVNRWGTDLDIMAFTNVYQRNVVVVTSPRDEISMAEIRSMNDLQTFGRDPTFIGPVLPDVYLRFNGAHFDIFEPQPQQQEQPRIEGRIERAFLSGDFAANLSLEENDVDGGTTVYMVPGANPGELKPMAIDMALHYACRGAMLKELCLDEWACSIEIRPLPADVSQLKFGERVFRFHPRHPLFESYAQFLRQRLLCPLYSGNVPRGVKEGSEKESSAARESWGAFICATKIPWDCESAKETSWGWDSALKWARAVDSEKASFVEKSRLEFARRIAAFQDGESDRLEKMVLDTWHTTHQKIWGQPHALDIDRSPDAMSRERDDARKLGDAERQKKFQKELNKMIDDLISAKESREFAKVTDTAVFEIAAKKFCAIEHSRRDITEERKTEPLCNQYQIDCCQDFAN